MLAISLLLTHCISQLDERQGRKFREPLPAPHLGGCTRDGSTDSSLINLARLAGKMSVTQDYAQKNTAPKSCVFQYVPGTKLYK